MKNLDTLTQLSLFVQLLLGGFFLAMVKSDIQLGFGLVLLTQFFMNWKILVKLYEKTK